MKAVTPHLSDAIGVIQTCSFDQQTSTPPFWRLLSCFPTLGGRWV